MIRGVVMYIVARYRNKRYEILMRESYRDKGIVKKREIYLMTYKLYWLNKKNDYPQIDREYLPQPENISANSIRYFQDNENLMDLIVAKVRQKEKERKICIDERKEKFDEEIKQFREKHLKKCGGY